MNYYSWAGDISNMLPQLSSTTITVFLQLGDISNLLPGDLQKLDKRKKVKQLGFDSH